MDTQSSRSGPRPFVRIERIDLQYRPAFISMPLLAADSFGNTALTYRVENCEDRAALTFHRAVLHRFGAPNDEAISGHYLYGHGLHLYEFQEVHNSPWLADEDRRNRVSFPDFDWAAGLRHFLFSWQDGTFEVLADGYEEDLVDQR